MINCFQGVFLAIIAHYSNGIEVKRFPVEELLITDINSDIYAEPEIATMERDIRLLKQELESEKEVRKKAVEQAEINYQEMLDRYNVAQELLFATQRRLTLCLIKFAYKDYVENVYLENGTFDDFLNEFGFLNDFTEEEIKFIKGEKQ